MEIEERIQLIDGLKKLNVFHWSENNWAGVKFTPVKKKYVEINDVIKLINDIDKLNEKISSLGVTVDELPARTKRKIAELQKIYASKLPSYRDKTTGQSLTL